MSSLLKFPKASSAQALNHIEATPEGIRLDSKLIGYTTAIRQLDEGHFDYAPPDGMRIIAGIHEGEAMGWFAPTTEQMALIWRWLITCLFIHEQQDKNGTVIVENEDGSTSQAVIYSGEHGGMAIYLSTERCSLATHIEGIAIQKYGAEAGLQRAIQLYQGMAEADPDGGALRLSQWGRDSLTMLHDNFIQMLNTEGLPAAPTAH
ncbi:hypothetical protein D8682_19685 [Buttiauxella sp. 3AFRM03]|uniref:hypothetical protein n=1 Tax=Buttiauxella sp. 3AFRM03 TaxID=2479367 RepID=UPI000EF7CDE7|nr:hypothetical protein [Buttiauxella sp. 3AFRM03]AYN29010.1 hypothetical protein D8682_19685 [Buttiauxella sp. 3AFRM03]